MGFGRFEPNPPVTPAEAGVQFVGLSVGWVSEVRSFRKGCDL